MLNQKNLYLIDCSFHFRASFFALPPIFTPDGKLVNAVFGFLSTLFRLLKTRRPDSLIIADDAHGKYFRHQLYPPYKSEKKPVPKECNEQMPTLLNILTKMAIPYITADGFEADDVMATLAMMAGSWNSKVYICSKDKDLRQIVSKEVILLDISSWKEVTVNKMEQEGVRPCQIPDLLSMTGDKVDSIPGIPGIGYKTAIHLLKKYRTLENILDDWNGIGGTLGNRIREYREQALLSKELATLRTDVPIEIMPKDLEFRFPDRFLLDPLFRDLGFEHLLDRLDQELFL